MPDAATSVARICLRCEARLSLRSRSLHFLPGRLFKGPRLLSTTISNSSTGDDVQDSSKLAKVPPRTIYGPRGRELAEHTANLRTTSLAKPFKIVVLRETSLEGRKKPHLDVSLGTEKEYASPQHLLESITAEKRILGVEDVKTNLELLRPHPDENLLSRADCDELANKVRKGFTTAQLTRYMQDIDIDVGGKLASGRETSKHSRPLHDQYGRRGSTGQTKWKPGETSALEPGDPLPALDDSRKLTNKDRLVSRLLRDYWKIQDVIESIDELELKIPPLEMSLLLGDKGRLLKDVSERHRAKMDVFRSKGIIKVTADKESANSAMSDIRGVLSQLQCMEVDLRPFRASDGGSKAASQFTKKSALQTIGQMTGTEIAIQNDGDIVSIYCLGRDMTPVFDARRLLLSQLQMPSQYQQQNLCGRDSSIEAAVPTSIGLVSNLAWYERGISWSRLQLPVFKVNGGEESQSEGVTDLYDDHGKLVQSIRGFLRHMGGIRAPQGHIADHAEERRLPMADMGVVSTKREEQEAKWETVTESKTAAVVGYILQGADKSSFAQPTIGRVQVYNRAFSHNVPGLLRSLSALQALEPTKMSESLLIHLRPSPWSSQNSNLLPIIEILIDIDPVTKSNRLRTVQAITSHQISDLALPDKSADLRFQHQASIALQNPDNSPTINTFLAQSHLDIQSQGRLITPPSLMLKIPQWTTNRDITTSPEDEGEVEVEYLFSALSHHQTLPLCVNGWKAQYTSIEAGRAGGRRGEFQIVMERVPEQDSLDNIEFTSTSEAGTEPPSVSESDFNHFFTTALEFVSDLKRWV